MYTERYTNVSVPPPTGIVYLSPIWSSRFAGRWLASVNHCDWQRRARAGHEPGGPGADGGAVRRPADVGAARRHAARRPPEGQEQDAPQEAMVPGEAHSEANTVSGRVEHGVW